MSHYEPGIIHADDIPEFRRLVEEELRRIAITLDTQPFVTIRGNDLTIASGVITITDSYHRVDTQSAASTDDLDTISDMEDGFRVVLQAVNTARTVVCKDGTGNLQLAGDFSLDNTQDTIELIYNEGLQAWCELSRSDNGA